MENCRRVSDVDLVIQMTVCLEVTMDSSDLKYEQFSRSVNWSCQLQNFVRQADS